MDKHLNIRCITIFLFVCIVGLAVQGNAYILPDSGSKEADSLKLVLAKPLTPQEKIKTLSALGKAYYTDSELDKALETEYQLLDMISKHGEKIDSAKCFRLIGLVYMQKSWYDKSLDNLMRAQHLFGESGDSAMQAKALMNVGIVHDCMNNYPMSLSYYNKALDYFKRTKNENGIADCELNIAIVLAKQKNYKPACENLLSAIKIYEKAGNDSYLAAAYINFGLTSKKMGNYDLAIEYLDKALKIWKQEEDQYHICFYHLNMGEIMLDMKRTEEAGQHLNTAEKLAKEVGSKDLLAKAYEFLSDYHAARNNFKDAYSFLDKSKQLNDSILNAETTEKVSQIQYQYEIAKREVEKEHLVKQNLNKELELSKKNLLLYILGAILVIIAVLVMLLVTQNRIKKKANEQLEVKNDLIELQRDELISLNVSKDKFLSILAHDIKNPLSSIHGISDLLISDYDKLTEEEKKIFTRDIHTLATNLFEIINTLLTWSTSQSGMITYRPTQFSIGKLCGKSANNLQTVAKQKDIVIESTVDENLMVLADENMIISVLHNLINNAIKYSYHGTKIRIESIRSEGFAQISVIDAGIGLSAESQSKLFKYDQHFMNKGTAGETGTGLGLILCKDFVAKNGGTIKVESTLKEGSTFVFTLPLASAQVSAHPQGV
ncbi:MAG: tetratricopeptide repeat protein [Bacteroidales bacterium]|nr:tetratricopeptide repeat protein [Bacteroidales bacterium]